MLTNTLLRRKPILALMELGFCFWRLWILLLAGLYLSLFTYSSLLPQNALYFIFFFLSVWYISSDFRNRLFAKDTVSLLTLWPISPFKKVLWVQMRGTWLPTFLLLLGTQLGYFITGRDFWALGATNLLFILSGAALIGLLSWQGRFYLVDGGAFVGKVSHRQKDGMAIFSLLICSSPLLLVLSPKVAPLFLCAFYTGTVFVLSSKYKIQIGGGFVRKNKASKHEKKASFSSTIKSPLMRYYCYLEYDFFRTPFLNLFIFMATISFMVVFFYMLCGLFKSQSMMTVYQKSLHLGLLIPFFTFYLSGVSNLEGEFSSLEMLMPLPRTQAYIIELASRFVRPFIYTFIGVFPVVSIIYGTNFVLSNFIEVSPISYSQMIGVTLTSSLNYLPLVLSCLSALMLISKSKLMASRLAILSYLPLIIGMVLLSAQSRLWFLETFLRPTLIVIPLFLFVFFELVLYRKYGKRQVIK